MRLIDADALLDKIHNPYQQVEVARWVNDMPTIEPERKKGKWIRGDAEKIQGKARCSCCNESSYKGKHYFNFCPNCGADMRGEENG